jgi:hypothetical protein
LSVDAYTMGDELVCLNGFLFAQPPMYQAVYKLNKISEQTGPVDHLPQIRMTMNCNDR